MIKVYAVHIEYTLDGMLFKRLMSFLSEDKRERIKKFRRIEDAQRALVADILIRYVICNSLDVRNKDIFFSRNEFGKPFLNNFEDFHFNISHAGEWVVCAVHNLPVGIDIEYIQPIDIDIAERFFSKLEYNDLLNIDISKRLEYFYDLWTLKESYIKLVGKGLSISLDSFSFTNIEDNLIFKSQNEPKKCYFKRFNIDVKYKMAVCSLADNFPSSVRILGLDEITAFFIYFYFYMRK